MKRRIIVLMVAITAALVSLASCTFTMCHPYKLIGLCELVGPGGWEKPR